MAEKGFGVKEINLIGASGTPTIESPNNLNLNAVNVAISTNVSIGGTLTVTGNVSVGGTLTYEDVTNIDSVGLITARSGIDCNGDIDVDGHTNLDNVSIAGVTTMTGNLSMGETLTVSGNNPNITFTDTNSNPDYKIYGSNGAFTILDSTNSVNRFAISSDGNIAISNDLDVDGHTNLDNVSIVGVATVTGSNINIEGGSASLSQLKINSTGRYRGIQLDENGTRKAHFQHDATDNKLVVGTAEGTMQFNSGDTPRVTLNSSGHWVPYTDSTYDLGLTGTRWRNLYADTLYGDGSNITGIAVTEAPVTDYTITGDGSHYYFHGGGVDETAGDPDLYLIRGQKYRFNNTTGSSHPFEFRAVSNGSAYTNGVTGDDEGVQFFTVPYDAPAKIFYICTVHSGMVGNIYIRGANGQNDNVGVTTFSGNVTINDGSGEGTIKIGGQNTSTGGTLFYEISGSTYLRIKNLYRSNSSNGNSAYIEYDAGYHKFLAGQGGNEKLRITSGGDILLGAHGSRIFDDSSGTNVVVDIYGGTTAGKRGILALGGRTGSDNADIGTIQFLNENNGNATSSSHAQSKLVASIDTKSETTTSNSGANSGGHLIFSTKAENAGLTERARITSDGYLIKAAGRACAFNVRGTNMSRTDTSGYICTFNDDSSTGCFDSGNNFNTSTYKFIAPVTGIYYFFTNIRLDSYSTGYIRTAFLSSNYGTGSTFYNYPETGHVISYPTNNNIMHISTSTVVQLDKDDELYVWQDPSADNSYTAYLAESSFGGYLIG